MTVTFLACFANPLLEFSSPCGPVSISTPLPLFGSHDRRAPSFVFLPSLWSVNTEYDWPRANRVDSRVASQGGAKQRSPSSGSPRPGNYPGRLRSFEERRIDKSIVAESAKYLKAGIDVAIQVWNGKVLRTLPHMKASYGRQSCARYPCLVVVVVLLLVVVVPKKTMHL